MPGGVTPLPFTEPLFDALDAEIRSVFGDDRLITPDQVQGKAKTLRDGVLAGAKLGGGWPRLGAARGKKVRLLWPQRGTRMRLVELAEKNAQAAMTARRDKGADVDATLDKLRDRFGGAAVKRAIALEPPKKR